jgi:hypothetical protein
MQKLILLILIITTSNAKAYIGPGVAIGALFGTIGIVIGAVVTVIYLLYSPLKKLYLRYFKNNIHNKESSKTKKNLDNK